MLSATRLVDSVPGLPDRAPGLRGLADDSGATWRWRVTGPGPGTNPIRPGGRVRLFCASLGGDDMHIRRIGGSPAAATKGPMEDGDRSRAALRDG